MRPGYAAAWVDGDRARQWLNTPEVRAARRRRELARLRRRRARRRRALVVLVFVAALLLSDAVPLGRLDGAPDGGTSPEQAARAARSALPRRDARLAPVLPARAGIARARGFARRRAGAVSFAVVDTRGRLRCHQCRRRYVSASVVKAMLLVAYLDRVQAERQPLTSHERALLGPMIRVSDNLAANAVYHRVGDAGLYRVARRVRMRDFGVYGYWANAQLTAADQARFFARMERLVPRGHRAYARALLSAIVAGQAWGIPEVSRPRGWRTFFKGGWRRTGRGELVHQIARLERRGGSLTVAVLTDGNPSQAYGRKTVRGIAARLLGARRRAGRGANPSERGRRDPHGVQRAASRRPTRSARPRAARTSHLNLLPDHPRPTTEGRRVGR
jgi:hypothetical protein